VYKSPARTLAARTIVVQRNEDVGADAV
jgi:hypothetical protein